MRRAERFQERISLRQERPHFYEVNKYLTSSHANLSLGLLFKQPFAVLITSNCNMRPRDRKGGENALCNYADKYINTSIYGLHHVLLILRICEMYNSANTDIGNVN